jgi:catechol 2,3-dioxygenase-like lactoylglutathione lyase family enzyme
MARFNSLEPRLHIADFHRSLAFYRDVLGCEVLALFEGEHREFAFRDPDGHLIIISEETDDPVTAAED